MENTEHSATSSELANGLRKAAQELTELKDLLRSERIDVGILSEFRIAVDQVRLDAWAAYRKIELPVKSPDREGFLAISTSERVARPTQLLKELGTNSDASMRLLGAETLEEFFHALAGFYHRLAPYFNESR